MTIRSSRCCFTRRCWHATLFLVLYAASGVVSETLLRLNCGGPSLMDSQGNAWIADASTNYLIQGNTRNRDRSIQVDPADLPLYQYEVNGDVIQYEMDLSSMTSTPTVSVTLVFTEPQGTRTAGKRTFDIRLQDNTVYTEYDIYVAAGGKHLPTSIEFPNVALVNGILSLELVSNQGTDVAIMQGFVVTEEDVATIPTSSPTAVSTLAPTAVPTLGGGAIVQGETTVLYQINCGGVLGSQGWNEPGGWEADDAYLQGPGNALTRSRFAFRNPDNLFYYQTERADEGTNPLEYSFPAVTNGNYQVELLFTEVQHSAQGQRLMDIYVEDMSVPVETAFDIFAASGDAQQVTLVMPYSVTVSDDNGLQIKLQAVVHNAKINAIRILQVHNDQAVVSDAPSMVPTASPEPSTMISVLPTIEPETSPPTTAPSITPLTSAPTATLATPTQAPVTASPTLPAGDAPAIRLNCGGTTFVDSDGHEWLDDRSNTYRKVGVRRNGYQDYAVVEADQPLYDMRSEGALIRYEIDVSSIDLNAGNFVVQLHFAEPYNNRAVGTRVFHIRVQGTLVEADFDVMQVAGSKWVPVELEFHTMAQDFLVIEFEAVSDVAIVNGITILSQGNNNSPVTTAPTPAAIAPTAVPTVSPTTTPTLSPSPPVVETPVIGPALRLNCGGTAFTDSEGQDWADDRSDTYRMVGVRRNGYQDYLVPEADQPLYDTRSEGALIRYEIDVSSLDLNSGKFHVQLHFSEPYNNRPLGTRVFHIRVQGSLVEADFDVMEVAGSKWVPIELEFDTMVATGELLVIEFEAVSDVAIVNGIAVQTGHWAQGPEIDTSEPSSAPSWGAAVAGPGPTAAPTNAAPTPDNNSEGYVKRLNVCGPTVYDENNVAWENDDLERRRTNTAYSTTEAINGAVFESIYQTACDGQSLGWRIDNLPQGDYNIIFHFAEIDASVGIGERLFEIEADAVLVVTGIDIAATVGQFAAFTQISYVPSVTDGRIDIRCNMAAGSSYRPMIAAVEIIQNLPHLSHAVPGGPYMAVARQSQGNVLVPVNGIESHTHGSGAFIHSWKWFFDGSLIGQGAMADLSLPVGTHIITLEVEDSDGSADSATTTVVVEPKGYPFIDALTPDSGEIGNADYSITLTGVGFLGTNLVVHFGPVNLHGNNSTEITIISDTELVLNPAIPSVRTTTGPVFIYVETDIGVSNSLTFTQYDEPFFFEAFDIIDGATNQPYHIFQPTCLVFGPDEKLYVGTRAGELHKLTLDDNWLVTEAVVSTAVSDQSNVEHGDDRAILGITFDPLDVSITPTIYITTSILNHRESVAWEGLAINGRVVAVTGENMDTLTNVITGLPLLDRDHSVSGIEFGDHGELYINNGGNTNAGVPGAMSIGTGTQEEGYLSGACNVAHLSRQAFDGHVTYDNFGNKVGGIDVEVFASGTRNPYDLVLHSNGYIYGTDNGPNTPYGPASLDCNTDGWDKPESPDELNLIEYNNYYGHPNRKRGEEDARQCTYHHTSEVSDGDYTAPLATLPSSVDGIVEFKSNHFGGSMRGQLVIGQFKGVMFRVALTPDGRGVMNNEVIPFLAFGGLDVTQAPNGALMSVRYHEDKLLVQVPIEEAATDLEIKSVFPYRGHLDGGSTLNVYGVNMDAGSTPTVTVGGAPCTAVTVLSSSKLTCKLPARPSGKADVVVDNGLVVKTFTDAYRYITGIEE